MRLVWLFESVEGLRGHALRAVRDAESLAARGHEVLVLAKDAAHDGGTGPLLEVPTLRVGRFDAASIPDCDVLLATHWTTVEPALRSGRGLAVHCCAGYEPATIQDPEMRGRATAVYQLPLPRIAISPHVARLLRQHAPSGVQIAEIVAAIDTDGCQPTAPRPRGEVLRVGLAGPWERSWQGVREGVEACRRAIDDGMRLQMVRIAPGGPCAAERELDVPTEWHSHVAPAAIPELLRSLDLLIASATGPEQGCFLPPIEAMACGVPCVLTDVPSHRDYAPGRGDYALFVEPGNVQQLTEAVQLLGGHDGLRQQLVQPGLEVARRFAPERHVEQLETALEQLLAKASAAPRPLFDSHRSARPVTTPATGRSAALPPLRAPVEAPLKARQRGPLGRPARAATPAYRSRITWPAEPQPAAPPQPTTPLPPAPPPRPHQDIEVQLLIDRLVHRGDRQLRCDHFTAATASFAAARCLAPDDPLVIDRLGTAAFLADDPRRALQAFDDLLALAGSGGDHPGLQDKRGMVLLALERWAEAADCFERSCQIGAADADTFNRLGIARHGLGDAAGARDAFREALRRDDSHVAAAANLRALDRSNRPVPLLSES